MTTLRPRAIPSGLSTVGLRAANGLPIVVGTTLAVAYLLAPPMGADLSAQVAWAEVAERGWPALLDLRWYGGVNPLGYSVLAPPLMALLGVRLATAVGYLAGVVVVTALFQRVPVRRPVAGGVVAALGLAGNLASSRTTFVLGLAIALGALLAVAYHRRWLAVLLAVLTALTSPVAALFLMLAGVALALSGHRRTGIRLSASAAGPTIIVGLLFGNGGLMPFGPVQAAFAVLASLIVVAACWDVPVVRWAALLSAVVVVVAYVVPNPVGSNAARLAELLAPAALVAVSGLPGRAVAALGVIVMVPQPLLYLDEVRARGEAALDPAFYAPLAEQLEARRISEPVEVVPMRRHGEAAAIASVVPLARGWIRQVDVGRNGVFYDGSIGEGTYRRWLDNNGVAWVALARGEHDWAAGKEAALVRAGLPYLRPVWANQTWTLYEVTDATPVVTPPGRVLGRGPDSLTLELPAAGKYDLRVRWSRWLSASAGCLERGPEGWTRVVVEQAEVVRLTSRLMPRPC
jgi:hypothetical protein